MFISCFLKGFAIVILWGSAGRGSPLNSHPETRLRRTTMCVASVALAIERSAAGVATIRNENPMKSRLKGSQRTSVHVIRRRRHDTMTSNKLLKECTRRETRRDEVI